MLVRQLVDEVRIAPDTIIVELNASELAAELGMPAPLAGSTRTTLTIPVRLKRIGGAVRLLQGDGRAIGPVEPQQHLLRLLHRARSWWDEMIEKGMTPSPLARQHGVTSSYASRLIRLNFLAPEIIKAIISGAQPASLDAKALLNLQDLPTDWTAQKDMLLLR